MASAEEAQGRRKKTKRLRSRKRREERRKEDRGVRGVRDNSPEENGGKR